MNEFVTNVLRERLNSVREQREAFVSGAYQKSLKELNQASKTHNDSMALLARMDEQISDLSDAIIKLKELQQQAEKGV